MAETGLRRAGFHKQAFVHKLELAPGDWLEVEHAELLSARGAALAAGCIPAQPVFSLSQLIDRINNVLCLQPFGCIANQVIAKGVARRLKEIYPKVNLLFLDLDAGGSEVNLINRAHFFLEQARAQPL